MIDIYTGKGGVGKTTVSSAAAVRRARSGVPTLLISTDPAHSVADVLGVDVGAIPTLVEPRLWAVQPDPTARVEQQWSPISRYLAVLFDRAGVEQLVAQELCAVPGLDDVLSLLEVVDFNSDPRWDRVIVDGAPTAETLRLLSLPAMVGGYLERLAPLGRRWRPSMVPAVARRLGLPEPTEELHQALRRGAERMGEAHRALVDPAVTTVRLVTTPDSIVVAETIRTNATLSLFGYRVAEVVVNRVLASDDHPLLAAWRDRQLVQLERIHQCFDAVPVTAIELRSTEPLGTDALAAFLPEVGSDQPLDPAISLSRHLGGEPTVVLDGPDGPSLEWNLPGLGRELPDVAQVDDDIFVTLLGHRRRLSLPAPLSGRAVESAAVTGGRLVLRFQRSGE